jgi:hypothetical protein
MLRSGAVAGTAEVVVRDEASLVQRERASRMTNCLHGTASALGKPRRKRRPRRGAVTLLSANASVLVLSAVGLAPAASASQVTAHASSSSAFCAKMPSGKVSSIVGWSVTLGQPVVEGTTVACLYQGTSGNVTIEKETGMAASSIATRQKAEASHKKLFYASQPKPLPKGTTISFSPLAALGSNAFYWTGVIAGSPYSGADAFKGTTGYFSEMTGKPQDSKLEKLEQLALSA